MCHSRLTLIDAAWGRQDRRAGDDIVTTCLRTTEIVTYRCDTRARRHVRAERCAMIQSMFATKAPCPNERINPRNADAPASTAFEHECHPVAAARFWRADALAVASALPFELHVTFG